MVITLEMLQKGILLVSKKFSDGSVCTFHATASPNIIMQKRLIVGKIYNLDTMKVIQEEEIFDGSCSVIDASDIEGFNRLDKYMNRGVAGECFKS